MVISTATPKQRHTILSQLKLMVLKRCNSGLNYYEVYSFKILDCKSVAIFQESQLINLPVPFFPCPGKYLAVLPWQL